MKLKRITIHLDPKRRERRDDQKRHKNYFNNFIIFLGKLEVRTGENLHIGDWEMHINTRRRSYQGRYDDINCGMYVTYYIDIY